MTNTMQTDEPARRQPSLIFHCLLFLLFNSYFGSIFGILVATGFNPSGMLVLILPLLFMNAVPSFILWLIDLSLMKSGTAHWVRALVILINPPALAMMLIRGMALAGIDGGWTSGALSLIGTAVACSWPAAIITAIIAIRFWPSQRV